MAMFFAIIIMIKNNAVGKYSMSLPLRHSLHYNFNWWRFTHNISKNSDYAFHEFNERSRKIDAFKSKKYSEP